ncbi:transporter [Corallincola luteus]|uniref:Transporter n=2 Tax=Corallincola TaxID=1775176 RepID=A0A368N691_9GAMM|nr:MULTISPECIES: transporter [Corallincola]RCU45523.1 transporter [Corallincola holothuriorum]TCI02594.1 transporter [Corallincola luteus]
MALRISLLKSVALQGLLALCTLFVSLHLQAEDLEPRRWAHLPINTNFLGAGYASTKADIDFDPVLKIEEAEATVDTWVAKYIRTFELFDKSARIGVAQGYQKGHWTGILDGEAASTSRDGATDTLVRFAVNLYGSPPLEGKEFVAYRKANPNETIVGAGISVQLPTGDYMSDKLINLGTNRYTLRPQIGAIHTRGQWSFESTARAVIYFDNDDFYGGKKLENDPLYVLSGHLIYTHRPGIWGSISAAYDYGAKPTVDGVEKDSRKEELLFAASVGIPINRHLGIKLGYIGSRTQRTTGVDTDSFVLAMSGYW